jgi:hypothetical protein
VLHQNDLSRCQEHRAWAACARACFAKQRTYSRTYVACVMVRVLLQQVVAGIAMAPADPCGHTRKHGTFEEDVCHLVQIASQTHCTLSSTQSHPVTTPGVRPSSGRLGNAPIPVSLPCRGSMMSGGGAGASSGASRGEPHTGQTGAGQQMYSTGSARRMTVRTLLLPVHAQAASGFRNGTTQ